ncbi:MAG: 50S ribosomal protein L24 [Kiritimatiellia bacterium]|jgi:large subunit ribosomal protein L24
MSVARIKKNDTVIVIAGEYAGQTGRVLRVDPKAGKAFVEGINMIKKAVRRQQGDVQGKNFDEREAPVELSNLMPYDPDLKRGVRIERVRQAGRGVRKAKRTGRIMD